MKKRGFTLIELLAVIVVLAIIALIATPVVMNTIKKAQKGSAERSAERYLSAVETAIATDRLDGDLIADNTYTVNEDGNLELDEEVVLTIEVSGDKPTPGSKIVIVNGQVVSTGTRMIMGNYTATIDSTEKATATKTLILCKSVTPTAQAVHGSSDPVVAGVKARKSAPYAYGAEYTCELGDRVNRTFYVLKEDKYEVKLLMNESLGETVKWCAKGKHNSCAGDNAKAALADQTSGWKTLTSIGGTVSLPVGQDIADAMEDTKWTDNKYSGTLGPDWMRTNISVNSVDIWGYWTSTAHSEDSFLAWLVTYEAELASGTVDYDRNVMVRPVITIPKANISL